MNITESREHTDPSTNRKNSDFYKDLLALGTEIKSLRSQKTIRQLHLFNGLSWLISIIGYGFSWSGISLFAILFLALGNFTRWSLVFHTINHGAADHFVKKSSWLHSSRFAHSWRRFIDWPDWILPRYWDIEHNKLHHHHTNHSIDPDLVWRNTKHLRNMGAPLFVKYLLLFIVSIIWKPFYYAPNTIVETYHRKGLRDSKNIDFDVWNPFQKMGRELWLQSLLPYFFYRFLLIPMLFLPLGQSAVIAVIINSVLAEFLANFYGFVVIATNHTGDDVPLYHDKHRSREEAMRRQIESSVNFSNGPIVDFFLGGLNYQIEHHLWPRESIYQYRAIKPKLKNLCQKYEVDYKEQSVFARTIKTSRLIVGQDQPQFL